MANNRKPPSPDEDIRRCHTLKNGAIHHTLLENPPINIRGW